MGAADTAAAVQAAYRFANVDLHYGPSEYALLASFGFTAVFAGASLLAGRLTDTQVRVPSCTFGYDGGVPCSSLMPAQLVCGGPLDDTSRSARVRCGCMITQSTDGRAHIYTALVGYGRRTGGCLRWARAWRGRL